MPEHGALQRYGRKPPLRLIELAPWQRWKGPDEARRAIRFLERYVTVPTGHGAGAPIKVAQFQRKIVRALYDNLATFVSIPTANGKTSLAGGLALERLVRGDSYVEVDVLATKAEQAGFVVDQALRMVESQPELVERCAWYSQRGILEYRQTGSRLAAHPARISSLQGLNPTLVIIDEVGFADDALIDAIVARLSKRPDAHLLGIGTPGFEPNFLYRIRRLAQDNALPSGVAYLEWSAPEGCELADRSAWRQANPALAAGFLSPEALATQIQLLPEHAARVYLLGQWVEHAQSWLPAGAFEACPYMGAPPDGSEIVLAVEGTYRRTLSVCGAPLDGSVFHAWTAEAATDAELRDVLERAHERWKLLEIAWPARVRPRLYQELRELGLPVQPADLTATIEAQASAELYQAISEQRLPHDHDPLLSDHVARLQIRYAADGSMRLMRPADGQPADAGIAMRNAWWRATQLVDQIPAEPIRIY